MAAAPLSSGELGPKDPFLRAHYVGPLTYDLSGRFRPPAIRDQMIRARLLVDRAYGAGLFRANSILIVGAGVAGVSVAVQAAKHGVRSVIAEQSSNSFGRFVLCSSRWVDPAQYDWPADDWRSRRIQGLPLDYPPGWPSLLTSKWRARLAALEADGKTEVIYGLRLERDRIAIQPTHVEAELRDGESPRAFDFAVYCEGPGLEDCRAGKYRGLEFFQDDPFEEETLGLPQGVTPQVLISGGGDGALQDFIRIASGARSASQLYDQLFDGGDFDLERQISTAESQARRLLQWSAFLHGPEHDHSAQLELEAFYDQLLCKIDHTHWCELRDKFHRVAGARLRDERMLHVAHPCGHLSHCYPLNRFMACLVMSFLASQDPLRFQFIRNFRTASVAGVQHSCETAEECHGKDHLVTLSFCDCLGTAAAPDKIGDYNVVVVRHGVKPLVPSTAPPMPTVRQILPYYLPL